MRQLDAQLRRQNFTAERQQSALFVPPSSQRFWLRTAPMWERVGGRVASVIAGGVLMIEVSKQVHAPLRPGLGATARRPLRVLEGLPKPAAEPA
ncbi:MAG: hypothetical protein OEY05_00120, partial [Paracoccaceae bacterium]|nr:hypothetical protein [Paracoccaceae bacterium]